MDKIIFTNPQDFGDEKTNVGKEMPSNATSANIDHHLPNDIGDHPFPNDIGDFPLPDDIPFKPEEPVPFPGTNPFTENHSTPMYGWVCPKCGSVLAPWVNQCPNCGPKVSTITYQPATQDPNFGFGNSVSTNVVNSGENTSVTQKKVITNYTTNFAGKPLYS